MSRQSLLSNELVTRLRSSPREVFRQQMQRSIARRAGAAGLSIDAESLGTNIKALDERYFTLRESGREAESMVYFTRARMLAALQFLHADEDEEALYEFTHSLDDVTPAAVIEELEKA